MDRDIVENPELKIVSAHRGFGFLAVRDVAGEDDNAGGFAAAVGGKSSAKLAGKWCAIGANQREFLVAKGVPQENLVEDIQGIRPVLGRN